MEKCDQIERSLIKKYRKPLWRPFIKAIQEYDLIQNGGETAGCIAGGEE